MFTRFDRYLGKLGSYFAIDGQIVDATVVAALRQRNNNGEKAAGYRKTSRISLQSCGRRIRDARSTVKFWKTKVDANGDTHKCDIALIQRHRQP